MTDDATPLIVQSDVSPQALSPVEAEPPEVAAPCDGAPHHTVATWLELRGPWRVFAMSEWIMRGRASFFDEIRKRHDLTPKLVSMALSTMIYLTLYGIVMGMSSSWQQALMSAIKLPVLFLVTLIICLPTLYFFNLLYGSQLTFKQTTALMMAAITLV